MSSGVQDLGSTFGSSGGGVSSLNGLTGILSIVAGSGITVTPAGSSITIAATGGGTGTVTTVSVVSANGLAGTVANATTTPAITLSTSITGLLKGNGTAISAAVAGTDYQAAGNYITALTGDVTASGPGSAAATLAATSNSTLVTLSGLTTAASLATVGTITSGTWSGTMIALNKGGTGSTTAPTARVALNIDQRSTFSNADYTVLSTDRYVGQVGTMSAARVATLPAASAVNAGQFLWIVDESGSVTTTNLITITAAGADTIDGSATKTIRSAYGFIRLISNGTNMWSAGIEAIGRGGTGIGTLPTNGQLLIGNSTSSNYTLAALTAGSGISVTNAAGSITLATTGAPPTGAAGGDLGGTYPNPTVVSVADVTTGTLTVPNGGSGAASFTAHGVILGAGTSAMTVSTAGTTGQPFVSNGASSDGTYQALNLSTAAAITGSLPVGNGGRFTPVNNFYTASTTMADPGTGCTLIRVRILGGGGGGGSGRKGATSSARSGGGGGSAGAYMDVEFPYASVGSWPVTITIGAGGAGAAAQATDSTGGVTGTNGGNSSFGSVVVAIGGQGAQGGQATASNATGGLWRIGSMTVIGNTNSINSTSGGTGGNSTVGAVGAGASGMAGSGAGGAGASAANAVTAGQAGGTNGNAANGGAAGGAGANGGNGTAGDNASPYIFPGGSGGGGAGSSTTAGFAGGNGGLYGSGGGGGSNGTDGTNSSGAGGAGAGGWMQVTAK